MSDQKPPAFQFYAADFLVGTAAMTAAEVGACIRFLCYQWTHGAVTGDFNKAAKMAGVSRTVAEFVLSSKFVKGEDGMYRSERLERVREIQERFRERQKENGAKGGRPPNDKNNPGLSSGLAQKEPNQNPAVNPNESSSSSSSSSSKTERDGVVFPPGFPGTLDAAISAIPVGIAYTREFIEGTWLKASSRGGYDAKGLPIRHWPNYVGSEWIFERNRVAKEKNRANNQQNSGGRVDRAEGTCNQGLDSKFEGIG